MLRNRENLKTKQKGLVGMEERKLIKVSEVNEHGYVGYRFSDSKRWASGKVKAEKDGRKYFTSKGEKYYLPKAEIEVNERQKKLIIIGLESQIFTKESLVRRCQNSIERHNELNEYSKIEEQSNIQDKHIADIEELKEIIQLIEKGK